MTINEDIQEASIRHMVWLERYKASEVKRIISLLNRVDADLVEQIAARMARIEQRGYDLGKTTTERLEALLSFVREHRKDASAALYDASKGALVDFAKYESDFQARIIENASGVTFAKPALSQLRAAAVSQPFQGRLLKQWYSDLGVDTAKKVSDAVKIGIVEGQTTDQIVRRIRGTRARQYKDGILEISRNQAQAIVRTAITHTAQRAKDELYKQNADVLQGVKWVSTLDGRTSAICRTRDGKIYPIDSGPRPPAHFNCRSSVVGYLGPSSIPGTRASAVGPVPDDVDYGTWLKRQSAEIQNEALGVKRAQLFRKGGLEIDRFSDATGKEYTLDELRAREGDVWDKTFKER